MIGKAFFAACLCMLSMAPGLAGSALAEPLAAPSGEVVLTVSGDVEVRNAPDGAALDLAALKRFPAREIRTTTDWREGIQHFKGVSAVAVLEALGVTDGTLTASAPDDYSVEIPMAGLRAHEAVRVRDDSDAKRIWLLVRHQAAPLLKTLSRATYRGRRRSHSLFTLQYGSHTRSGRGAAWLARFLGVEEVPSSNLGGPTNLPNNVVLLFRSVGAQESMRMSARTPIRGLGMRPGGRRAWSRYARRWCPFADVGAKSRRRSNPA